MNAANRAAKWLEIFKIMQADAIATMFPGSANIVEVTDEQLMMNVRAGDLDAFDVLVERHFDLLAFYIGQMVGDVETAQDLAQETLLRAFRARKRYEPRARWTTWLRKIARNLALDERRRRRHGITFSLDEAYVSVGSSTTFPLYEVIPDTRTPSPIALLCEQETLTTVRRHVNDLAPKHSEVLKMRVYDEMNYQDIAEYLGCSLGTVKSRIHYAIRELRTRLTEDGEA